LVASPKPIKPACPGFFATEILQPTAGEGELGRVILGALMPS